MKGNSSLTLPPQQEVTITISEAQVLTMFDMLPSGQVAVLVQQRQHPAKLAKVLISRAAALIASLNPPEARAAIIEQIIRDFQLGVDTMTVAMRTTPGGVVAGR